MTSRFLAALGMTTAMIAVPVALSSAQQKEQTSDFRWSERIEAGRTVKISNINGIVTVKAGSGDRVEVTAVKRWRRGDPSRVKIHAANGDLLGVVAGPKDFEKGIHGLDLGGGRAGIDASRARMSA